MERPERVQLFDRWAQHYDSSVPGRDSFPHDGYEKVLELVAATASVRPGMTILDLGIGTGNLAAHFVEQGCTVWGVDFSSEMLKRARDTLPQVVLVQADLLCILEVLRLAHAALVAEDLVVHLPELALLVGGLGRLVGGLRFRVHR